MVIYSWQLLNVPRSTAEAQFANLQVLVLANVAKMGSCHPDVRWGLKANSSQKTYISLHRSDAVDGIGCERLFPSSLLYISISETDCECILYSAYHASDRGISAVTGHHLHS